MHRLCERIWVLLRRRAAWLRVFRHWQSSVCPTLTNHMSTSKKSRTLTDISYQLHAQKHRHFRPSMPKQPTLISPIQEHEQCTQRSVDQRGKIHGDGVHETFFHGVDGLAVLAVCTNQYRWHDAKSRRDASGVQHLITARDTVQKYGNGERIYNSGEFTILRIGSWQAWALNFFSRHRNIHMHIACWRVSHLIIAHGCG